MRTPALPSPRRIAAGAGLALLAAGLTPIAASANPAGTDLVITEAYVNGGSSGATYTNKFVEIHNPTGSAISLTGKSLQYRSPTGTTNATGNCVLSGSVAAGGYFVVQGGSNGANGAALPSVDQSCGGINPGGGGGTLFLSTGTTLTTPTDASVVDRLGYGTSNAPEGTAAGTASVTSSLQRTKTPLDTDVNATDFEAATPTPGAGYVSTPPPTCDADTIAEVQGTGTTSPCVDVTVTVDGVVTATYPTGGFNGFYIQTGGEDTTPDASDAIFVYGPSFDESTLDIGDTVTVTGKVSEFSGLTEITADSVSAATTPQAAVVPKTVIPGTDCALPGDGCLSAAEIDTAREKVEGEVFLPAGDYTVTDAYDFGVSSSSFFGEVGIAARSDIPLVTPTEVIDAQDTSAIAARTRYNAAHSLVMDDGSSTNYWNTSNSAAGQNSPVPWLTADHSVRVGAAVTFPEPVLLDYRFGWKLQPTSMVVGEPTASQPQVEQTRTPQPADVPGGLKLATFNVLNYFTTLGVDYGGCTSYNDRAGNPIAVNSCPGTGPRGAWDEASFTRQQTKIVNAINAMDADIVSVEEIENSRVVDDADRDEALSALVAALNTDAGSTRWAYVASPAEADLPAKAEEDVIRTGFIYDPATVATVGGSEILVGSAAFSNAREPFAQAFKAKDGKDVDAFSVIVNHFKSKGSGTDDGTGQGNANPDRVAQANALTAFAADFAADRGTDAVFLTGDFNAYSEEDPVQAIEGAGYTSLESTVDPDEETYSFAGTSGSLDHVFANEAAEALVKGVDVWEINANESVYYQYSRYNYIGTDLYSTGPFAASDHNPEIVGFTPTATADPTTDVQIIGSNDYHGRLAAGPRLAAYVKAARAANPDTVFAAAGDLVGATTFESFIQHDKPTIDVMNEAGLDVSAVGNHEFDAGYDDLVDRIMAPYDADTNPEGGAEWQYLGANVKFKADGSDALEGTWIKDFGAVQVGFVGAVTEDLPSLVSADGISDIEVTDIVDATNEAATDLKDAGADVVVLLVHEGAGGTSYASATTPGTAFGDIVNGVSPDVDAIISGHTHLAYNHSVPVPAWAGRAVTERPVVSAGQYGENLNRLVFTVDNATGEVQAKTQEIVPFASFPATGDAATQAIVTDANNKAAVLGAQPLGKIKAGFSRAKFVGGAENRGGESTLGNLVAEVQRWSTDTDIAFMNPGGLRADMLGTGTDYPRTVTYKNAADVQPFANTVMTMGLTGSSIKKVLEQQWQRTAAGTVPSRPFLKLGTSEGFEYTYDPTRPEGDRITGMWLDGVAIDAGTTYQVAANAFLASGTGDNFFAFSEAIGKRDSGKVDLAAMVDYMDTFATDADPLGVDYSQRAVGVAGLAAEYAVGDTVSVDLTSLAMTGIGDLQDTEVTATFDGQPVGTFAVDNTANPAGDANSNDEAGRATVSFTVPAAAAGGTRDLVVTGATTGTSTTVPVAVKAVPAPEKVATTVTGSAGTVTYGTAGSVTVKVAPATATGTVAVSEGANVIGAVTLAAGEGSVTLAPTSLSVGTHTLTLTYAGDAGHKPSTGSVTVEVVKAEATLRTKVKPKRVVVDKTRARVVVRVKADGFVPTGRVKVLVAGKTYRAKVIDGKAVVKLKQFAKPRRYKAKVSYLGDANTEAARTTVRIKVKRR